MLYPSDYMPEKQKPKPVEIYIEKVAKDNASIDKDPGTDIASMAQTEPSIATSAEVIEKVNQLKELFDELEMIDKQIWT